jgi:preprotein translocase subunit Sss1
MMMDRIERNYRTHEMSEDQQKLVAEIREHAEELAQIIARNLRPSREQSLAMTKLEEVVFWAVAGIARPPADAA